MKFILAFKSGALHHSSYHCNTCGCHLYQFFHFPQSIFSWTECFLFLLHPFGLHLQYINGNLHLNKTELVFWNNPPSFTLTARKIINLHCFSSTDGLVSLSTTCIFCQIHHLFQLFEHNITLHLCQFIPPWILVGYFVIILLFFLLS